ncbi:hypothetical protein RSOLAG1IB_00472 [Rhizoctonia solani AG-1 IB]|uniref:Uncharacterized protein n=1 Tax=Thanatephorus cucumeris (strain AG1-IB / isolate 7/3/14) TaxID=1108050 RepID=M5BP62_THACB|nr:hypothetical protein BN14_02092 [Rhizoctonia solani AG-1 IB]CEL51935.1 hypothetical protein RSOLAG1IB_00472 [Rhizoctonia solani AG-1 IB]
MSTPHARNIVRRLLANGNTLRVQELYARGLSEYPSTPFPPPPPPKQFIGPGGRLRPAPPQPPNPTHPFHSLSYLKDKVLPDLISAGEIEKFHSVVAAAPGLASSKKRVTKSKNALDSGGIDIWRWRLTGPQASDPEPKLEEEPIPDSHDWYAENKLFGAPRRNTKKQDTRADPYGARPWDHLNARRRDARPEKLRMEQEWKKSIEAARVEGARDAEFASSRNRT